MFATIIPLRRVPVSLSLLTYEVPVILTPHIKIGQLVTIPFGAKEEFGIVKEILFNNPPSTSFKIKQLKEIVQLIPAINQRQIFFLEQLAKLYHTPLGFMVKSVIFFTQKNNVKKFSSTSEPPKLFPSQISSFSQTAFTYKNEKEHIDYLLEHISLSCQNVIIVPDIASVNKILGLFPKKLKNRCTALSSEIKNTELFNIWINLWKRNISIILGTRKALFLPWSNVNNVFLDDEADPNHKNWDMAPRYHNRDAALLFAQAHQAKLHYLTHTPTIETYFQNYSKNISSELTPFLPPTHAPTMIVDLKEERKKKNFSLLSELATDLIIEAVQQKKSIFLFLNQRGSFKHITCQDCGYVCVCPTCQLHLTYLEQRQSLVCPSCGSTTPLITHCPVCKGARFKNYGEGTETLENTVKKIIGPSHFLILRLDANKPEQISFIKYPYLIIGTQLAWERVEWQKISLMVFVNADIPLSIPEYKITEQLWYSIRDAQYRLPPQAKLIVQTSKPSQIVFRGLDKPTLFYTSELDYRKRSLYPPFTIIVKLLYGHSSLSEATSEANQLYVTLTTLTKDKTTITILNPLETIPSSFNKKFWKVIIIKIDPKNYLEDIPYLLTAVPENWKIDINPSQILTTH